MLPKCPDTSAALPMCLTDTSAVQDPTQTPLLFSGSRLDRQWFLLFICAQRKNDRIYARIYMPHPTPFRYRFTVHFFNLSIYCRLYKGVQDPVSFTVTTSLLGRLGLGLRVRASIRIIFTFFSKRIQGATHIILYRRLVLRLYSHKSETSECHTAECYYMTPC